MPGQYICPRWGFVDAAGQEVVPCQFDCYDMGAVEDGYAHMYNVKTTTLYGYHRERVNACALKDANGFETNYVKLRDLGEALGFPVDWSAEIGVTIQTRILGAAGELKLANGEAVTEENVTKALEGLRKKCPERATWTELPHRSPALPEPVRGKEAFVYAISDDVFGDLPITETHSDPDKLLVGDVIRYNEGSGTPDYMLVAAKDGEKLKGVSLFSGLTIHGDTWDPSFFFGDDAFPRKNFTIFSRYPL